jgi:uncharacterized protein (TIGR02466 family)
MILHSLFPTPVGKFELGREFTTKENTFVVNQPTTKNMGNTVSNDSYVFRHDTLSSLLAFVQESVDTYVKTIYAPKEDVRLRVTQSWLNYSKPGEWHHKHAHPNSFVSGVLYIKAAKERDRIYFYNDTYEQISMPTENFNLFNSKSWWLPVETGSLMLFPSSLTHSVATVQEEERISLAFNTFPVGYVGNEDSLTALHLRD